MRINFGGKTAPSTSAALSPRTSGFDELARQGSPAKKPLVEEKFQDFVGSTFYREMLKSLRSGQKHSKYFYGGQAEEIFRGQLDQQISEELGHTHAGHLAGPLFEAYSRQHQSGPSANGTGKPAGNSPSPGPAAGTDRSLGASPLSRQAGRPEAAHALDLVI